MGEIRFPGFDPVFLDLWGPIDLRYYGLMYVVGFVFGQVILTRLAKSRFLPIPTDRVGDLIFYLILGVILGGRLGYSLFYKPEIFTEPLQLFKIWEGGLSFHGGLLGVVIALILFAKKHETSPWRLCDCLSLTVCPGILAVRCANFINGELYGRIIPEAEAASVPWAMRFPTDPFASPLLGVTGGMSKRDVELKILEAYENGTWGPPLWNPVPLRHPSQLYEAITEGLLLGLVLYFVYKKTRVTGIGPSNLGAGVFGGIFVAGYGVLRFFIEYYRQPDEHLGFVLGNLSMGQCLCIAMMGIGTWMILGRWSKRVPPEVAEADAQQDEQDAEPKEATT